MKRTVIAMGLPRTGKTTYLAAFWNVVGSAEVAGALQLERTSGDMQYLNEIKIAWANCQEITRTGPAGDRPVSMLLRDTESGEVTELAWTDMLGESFERQWSERIWTSDYQQLAEEAVGGLLFVHPHQVNESPLILDALQAAAQLGIEDDGLRPIDAEPQDGVGTVPIPWDPLKVATQVQLVELVQLLGAAKAREARLRLSVVISAWDVVERTIKVTPGNWFERSVSLLHQYLESNDDLFEVRVFGVSAQGGDYAEAHALRKGHLHASHRIKMVDGKSASHDITAPVRFAIGTSTI